MQISLPLHSCLCLSFALTRIFVIFVTVNTPTMWLTEYWLQLQLRCQLSASLRGLWNRCDINTPNTTLEDRIGFLCERTELRLKPVPVPGFNLDRRSFGHQQMIAAIEGKDISHTGGFEWKGCFGCLSPKITIIVSCFRNKMCSLRNSENGQNNLKLYACALFIVQRNHSYLIYLSIAT